IDNGIRLNQDELDLIFQPFKKKKIMKAMDIRDLGFGLILAKRLIELHEGKINIKNNQGNGTSFSFRIPKKLKELHS
ncbi:MAG: ATP-binding protein, partial [Promethearchaeota archaeon]